MRNGYINDTNVNTRDNLAGALTKYVDQDTMNRHMMYTYQFIVTGRDELAPATEC